MQSLHLRGFRTLCWESVVTSGLCAAPATWEVAEDSCCLGVPGQSGQHRKTVPHTTNKKEAVGVGVDGGLPGKKYLVGMPHPHKGEGSPKGEPVWLWLAGQGRGVPAQGAGE